MGVQPHSYLTSGIQLSCSNLQEELNLEQHPPEPLPLPSSGIPAWPWTFMGFILDEERVRPCIPSPKITDGKGQKQRGPPPGGSRSYFPCDPGHAYHVCATVKRRCLGMLLLRSILRRSLGEFLGEITGESLGDTDFLVGLGFSCCNRFSRRDFTRSSFSHGFGPCGLSTSGTAKVSGLVVGWAIFCWSTLYSWQQSRTTWLPGLSPAIPSRRAPGGVRGDRSASAAASSFGRTPASVSLGGDAEAGVDRVDEGSPSSCDRDVSSAVLTSPEITEALAWQRNMEGSHCSQGFVSAAKLPGKLSELMRRSCSADFCLCT